MHSRILAFVTIAGLTFTGCSSDSDDSPSAETTTGTSGAVVTDPDTTNTTQPGDEPDASASLELSDSAPAGADIVIDAVGTTTDRAIRRGAQSAIEQGQTFAVDDDTTLTTVSFEVVAPDGVPAGQSVELAVYEVGDTVTMVPSGPVDVGGNEGPVVLPLPKAIEPDVPTHLVFSLPDVPLSAGQYAVVLSFADGAGPSEMFLQYPGSDVYPDGVSISLRGQFWKTNTNDDDSAVTLTFGA